MSELRSKHAFGSMKNLEAALASGAIDAFDILFLNEGKIGWVDKNGNPVIPEFGNEAKFEISNAPEGTLINYGEKEIRVMCPADTKWTKQNVGATGNANMYYMAFKAYAPDEAVSFKEGDRGVIVDEMFTFDSEFAGVDENGRKYSICWLALASYDATSDTWSYFGSKSTNEKYIGWTYVVEWYDANGKLIANDGIRINLSNAECHSTVEPFYVATTLSNAQAYTDEQIEAKLSNVSGVEVVEF